MLSLDAINLGGPIIWIILGLGLLAFAVFVERALSLHRARIRAEDFLKGVFNILGRGNIAEAITICEDTPGPVAYLVRTAIKYRESPKDDLTKTLEAASEAEISRMERRLVVIATVSQIAPMLGLLGTILGMMEGLFAIRNQVPLVHSAHLMDGILMALTTTAAGLSVAIPCYAAFNLLVIKIDRLVLDMEHTCVELVAFLSGTTHENGIGK